MHSLMYICQYFEFDALPDRQPMQIHQNWRDMCRNRCKNNQAGCLIVYLELSSEGVSSDIRVCPAGGHCSNPL